MIYMIADISNAQATRRKICEWTGDTDNILAIAYQVGGWTTFSNTVFSEQALTEPVGIAWDPPGDVPRPLRGPSQHTYFDGRPLSSRDTAYQQLAVNWFADFVLGGYLRPKRFMVEPTLNVVSALKGQLPQSLKDIAALAQADPSLLNKVHCVEGDFDPRQLSPAARQVCRAQLEDEKSLAQFLEAPEAFIAQVEKNQGTSVTEPEKQALLSAAKEKPDLVRSAFDSVELGRARGDENTYVLIGVDPQSGQPDPKGFEWITGQLAQFAKLNGFFPAFGWFVTEACLRYRVILGPGTTQREQTFLQVFGHEIIDMSDGRPFTEPLAGGPALK